MPRYGRDYAPPPFEEMFRRGAVKRTSRIVAPVLFFTGSALLWHYNELPRAPEDRPSLSILSSDSQLLEVRA
jgi:hypothetical protein